MARAFVDWQARRLRDRLMRYRKVETLNGKDHPFERIARDILYNEKFGLDFVNSVDERSLGESFRRFAAGTQYPGDERLQALALFLIEKGYLMEHDLEQSRTPFHAPLSLLEYLGVATDGTNAFYNALAGHFRGEKTEAGNIRLSELEFSSSSQDGIVQVSLVESEFADPYMVSGSQNAPTSENRAGKRRSASARRGLSGRLCLRQVRAEGWAVVSPARQIIVFAGDGVTDSVTTLIALAHSADPTEANTIESIYMLEQRGVIGAAEADVNMTRPDSLLSAWPNAAITLYRRILDNRVAGMGYA